MVLLHQLPVLLLERSHHQSVPQVQWEDQQHGGTHLAVNLYHLVYCQVPQGRTIVTGRTIVNTVAMAITTNCPITLLAKQGLVFFLTRNTGPAALCPRVRVWVGAWGVVGGRGMKVDFCCLECECQFACVGICGGIRHRNVF
jgi:hypothetical protein